MSTRHIPYRQRPETIAARAAWLDSLQLPYVPRGFHPSPRRDTSAWDESQKNWLASEEGIAYVKAGRPLNWQWPPPESAPTIPTILDTLKEIERQQAANGLALFAVILILVGFL